MQTEQLSMSIQTPLSHNQAKHKMHNQYLFTNSSGGSGYGYVNQMPMMSSSGCGSDDDLWLIKNFIYMDNNIIIWISAII